MAQGNVNVVGQAQLNAGMSSANGTGGAGPSAATWSVAWFCIALGFILFIYFGFGGLRGSVAS